jgi:hypothetical protein
MKKSEHVQLNDEDLKKVIKDLQSVVPVYRIGMSLHDLQQSVANLSVKDLSLFSRCLYTLYKHADVAHEPWARESDKV